MGKDGQGALKPAPLYRPYPTDRESEKNKKIKTLVALKIYGISIFKI